VGFSGQVANFTGESLQPPETLKSGCVSVAFCCKSYAIDVM